MSLYQKRLQHRIMEEHNVWQEMQIPIADYKKAITACSFPPSDPVQLLISGFINDIPYTFNASVADTDRDQAFSVENFGCIGSGSHLAHYSLLNRCCTDTMNVQQVLYCVYEAKRWSELETGVGKSTFMCIQTPSSEPNGMILKPIHPEGLEALDTMYRRLGPQSYDPGTVALRDILDW